MPDSSFDTRKKFMGVTLIVTAFVAVFSLYICLAYASGKTIIVNDEEQTEEAIREESKPAEEIKIISWTIDTRNLKDKKADSLNIMIPAGMDASDVEISVRYDIPGISVTLKNTRESYFLSNPPKGCYDYIEEASGSFDGENTTVSFGLTESCLCSVEYENSTMELVLTPVSEAGHPLVVLDAGHGGEHSGVKAGKLCEKDVCLMIAKKVRDLSKDRAYTVLLTRSADESMTTEERIKSVEALNPDYFISIHFSGDVEDVNKFGLSACYNGTYYHNGLENVEFADKVLRNVAINTQNRALGLFEAGEQELPLKVLNMPATYLYAGFLSNKEEAALLEKGAYIEKIAQGIIDALDEVIQ